MWHWLLSLGNWRARERTSSRLTSHLSFWKSRRPIVPRQTFVIEIQNAYELSYPDAVFDSVVGSSVLHHLEIEEALREIYRVLKPGGTIYFTEPNMLNPQIAIQKNVPWVKRKLGDSPDETAFFRWPLRRLLEETGYRDVRIDPFDFLHPKTPVALIDRRERVGPVSRERACHLGICRLALYPCDQMSSARRSCRARRRKIEPQHCVTARGSAPTRIFFFGIASFTGINSRTFPIRAALSILEIGSGTSPLKQFLSNVITSDVLDLDYLDLVFDCHEIDKLDAIKDNSLDVITLTNVLHHLKSPIAFLNRAASKLKSGGKVIATEPFFSVLSTPIFKYLHHEPVDFRISEPELGEVRGPLASANIALPWLIFFRKREWLQRLNNNFDVATLSTRPFSALSYMATGGISRRLPIPHFLYRTFFSWISPLVAAFRASAQLFLP